MAEEEKLYKKLSEELMEAIGCRRPVPPKDRISESLRGEMAVLRLLGEENRRMTAGEISRLLSMTTSRMAAVLGSLEKKAFIIRKTDEADKRRVLVELTQKGRASHLQKKNEVRSHMQQRLMMLGEEDAREFVRLMKRMTEIMIELDPPQPVRDDELR